MKFFSERKVRVTDEKLPSLPIDRIADPVALTRAICNTSGRSQQSGYNYPRASEMDGACAREWVLGMSTDIKRQVSVHFGQKMVFGIGSAIHNYYQNSKALFSTNNGWWKCWGCDTVLYFGQKKDENCTHCGALQKAIRYKEHYYSLTDPIYSVCKYDLILNVASDRFRIGDIKGVGDADMPLNGSDVMQVCSMLFTSQYDTSLPVTIDPNIGYLFYISKKMNFKKAVRTFKVELTDVIRESLAEFYMMVKRGVDEGMVPPIPNTCNNAKKKKCPFAENACADLGDRNDFK